MSPLVLVLAAAALLTCPSVDQGALRLGALGLHTAVRGTRRQAPPWRQVGPAVLERPRASTAVMALGGGLLAAAAAGWAAGVAGAVLLSLGGWSVHRRVIARRLETESGGVLEALDAFTGELRAGRSPTHALRAAVDTREAAPISRTAVDRPDPVTGVLLLAAATAELGGDVPGALRGARVGRSSGVAAVFDRIAAGWQVSERSGASLGSVLERVALDLRSRRRHQRQVAAHLAGPRATGLLLALLPGFGVLLGTAMGAAPLTVLFHTPAGQAALISGMLLEVAGVAWTARILRHGGGP